MNMCTVREIREAIQEDCRSQRDMESTEIDRVFQTLPFSQERDLFDLSLIHISEPTRH